MKMRINLKNRSQTNRWKGKKKNIYQETSKSENKIKIKFIIFFIQNFLLYSYSFFILLFFSFHFFVLVQFFSFIHTFVI